MKEWFKARNIWGAAIATLSDEEAGRLMKALWHYTMNEEEEYLPGPERTIFALMLMTLKQDDATEAEVAEKRSEAGAKGGKQRVANLRITQANEANQANASGEKQIEANQANASNKNKNKEEEIDIKETLLTESKEKRTRFSPPSVEEVKEYCQERNNGVDAQTFVDFYASKGWKVGNSPMKDWKACVRTWEQRDNTPRATPVKPTKTVVAQQYEQRDYSGVQAALTAEQDDYYARRIAEKKAKQAQEDAEMEEWLRRESS